ncbi:type II secretion system F family protein [Nocardioides sp. zg-1308]|uniref:type II secretion system F family protein n=1 Tax=Nocardioides sp. zg-1308 TaxID=2736253 RepID=UPI00155227FF|nr:type II secretion system F family protein [Nocardioides sp. zg-1308]
MTWVSVAGAVLAVLTWLPAPVRTTRSHGRSGPDLRPVAAVGVGLGAWLVVGGATGIAAGVVAGVVARRVLAGVEAPSSRRDREEVERTLPHLIELLASTLHAGAEPVAGLARVCAALPGPAAERLRPVVEQARWGASGAEAWSAVADDPALAPLAWAMVRSQTSGASVVLAVERLSVELEREALARAEDAARKVGVSAAVPLGVCLLPAFMLLGVVPTVATLFQSVAP